MQLEQIFDLFQDVKPYIPFEGKSTILKMNYEENNFQAFCFLLRMIETKQYSERAYILSQFVLKKLNNNFNAWFILKQYCLKNNKFQQQYDFINSLIANNIKNFQIWEHRRFVTEHLQEYSKQITFCDRALNIDCKNYHAWSYRTWVVKHQKNYQEQLNALEFYFKMDIRNNSVWTYRRFLVNRLIEEQKTDLKSEYIFCVDKLKNDFENQSAWNYLKGLFECPKLLHFNQATNQACLRFSQFPQLKQLIIQKTVQNPNNLFVLSFLLRIYSCSQSEQQRKYGRQVALLLGQKNKMQYNYWNWYSSLI